jgi:aerobic carbon-monoxide dehydrogenase medium subunit
MAAAAVFYDQDASGKAVDAHVGIIGLGDRPRRVPEVEAALNGQVIDEAMMERAAEITTATVEAQEDIHASAAYRRSLAGTMVERALRAAATR